MKLMMITKTKKKKALERKKHICDFITTVLIVVIYRATWDTFQPQLNK